MIGNLEPAQYIRPYEPADYERVTAILHAADSFSASDHAAENFQRTHEDYGPDSTLVYASHDQEAGSTALVGVVRILSMEPDSSKAVIGDLALLPGQQPPEAGSQLLRAISNVARKSSPCCRPELAPELLANDAAGLRAADALAAAEIFAQPTLEELLADPEQLKSAAYHAAGEIHDTLLEWDYDDEYLQSTDVINKWLRNQDAPFSQMTIDDTPDPQTGTGMADLYMGHPYREGQRGKKLSSLVWCAVRAKNEAYQVLRLTEYPSDESFDMDFFDTDGHYVIRDNESETLYSLKVNNQKGKLQEKVTARTLSGKKDNSLFIELVQGTYTLDELHRHDLRWLGGLGYPWTS